jgi:hypothetical protein
MGTIYAKLCYMLCLGFGIRLSVITVPDSVPLIGGAFAEQFLNFSVLGQATDTE